MMFKYKESTLREKEKNYFLTWLLSIVPVHASSSSTPRLCRQKFGPLILLQPGKHYWCPENISLSNIPLDILYFDWCLSVEGSALSHSLPTF